jgi:hypothetical protein
MGREPRISFSYVALADRGPSVVKASQKRLPQSRQRYSLRPPLLPATTRARATVSALRHSGQMSSPVFLKRGEDGGGVPMNNRRLVPALERNPLGDMDLGLPFSRRLAVDYVRAGLEIGMDEPAADTRRNRG